MHPISAPSHYFGSIINFAQGMIQFHIDVVDRAARYDETPAIINRFPIDLKLTLGAPFTKRKTYTGIYNISGVGLDMSFRVQCSRNYYGPNCTSLCEPIEGEYTCDSEGRTICMHSSQGSSTNWGECDIMSGSADPTVSIVGGVLGSSVIINIILIIIVVVLVTKNRDTVLSPSLAMAGNNVTEGEGRRDTKMKPNSLYGHDQTAGSESQSIAIDQNAAYKVRVPGSAESNHSMVLTYEYVNLYPAIPKPD